MSAISSPSDFIIYNGVKLSDFNVYVSGDATYDSPERDITTTEVPGRSGDLLVDNGRFKEVTLKYEAWIASDDFEKNIEDLRNFLGDKYGYHKLEDTYHQDEYRMAAFEGPITLSEVVTRTSGKFTLEFTCKPQRYLKSGDLPITVSSGQILYNPTLFPARPLIRVTGSGEIKIGSYSITIASHSNSYIDIDCEMMEAYCGSTDCNGLITVEPFPELVKGNNVITYTGLSSVVITPRWWKI